MTKPLIQKTFENLPVDAGNISVYCSSILEGADTDQTPFGTHRIDLGRPGTYQVCIEGVVYGEHKVAEAPVTTRTGSFLVGDACYSRNGLDENQHAWEKLLKDTRYFRQPVAFLLPLDTGGDGRFTVRVTIKEQDKIQ